ncbi:MAG: DNA mismatch repair endonuclease MutL [Planctomycetota bacterium]
MGRIHVLDPHVVNQIAAGEVVERPASVVRELIDNALDAGARRIHVDVADGGLTRLEVADDGHGMDAADLARVFLPHATSKIRTPEDLLHIGTLGFRGEALASVGAVARVTVTSAERAGPDGSAAPGHRVVDAFGDIGPVEPAAASPGTVVVAEELFRHVPARRKFLRTPATELGHVRDVVHRFAAAFPDVAFRLRADGRTLLEAPSGEGRRARLARHIDDDVARALLEVHEDDGLIRLEAWIGPPSTTRRDGRYELTWLGGRHVRDRTVAHAVREAYRDLLPPGGARPVAFVFLDAPAEVVDVNVHPQKSEVRWRDAGAVHRLVRRALRRVLEQAQPGVPVTFTAERAARVAEHVASAFVFGPRAPSYAPSSTGVARRGPSDATPLPPLDPRRLDASGPTSRPPARADDDAAAAAPRTPVEGLRPIGQALGLYLVLEADDAIVLVDQHALHERVLFDRINARLREKGGLEVQRLLVPKVVHPGPAGAARLLDEAAWLATLGWDIGPFGDDAIAVHGVPAVLKRPDPEAALAEVLELLEAGRRDGLDRAALLSEAVDRLACRSAVMAGDRLDAEEVLALLAQAEALDHAHSCPHGRPTRLTLKRADLERWFHRTV